MSATALKGSPPAPPAPPVAPPAAPSRGGEAASPGGPRRPAARRARPTTLAQVAIRLAAFGALALFGAQAWGKMVRPEQSGRMVGAALVAITLAGLAVLAEQLPRRARLAAWAAILLLAGVPLHLLDPGSLGELFTGLVQGVTALPALSVPYRGIDEWNQVAMLLGGTSALVIGMLVAVWPMGSRLYGHPVVAVVVIAIVYAVPAIQLDPEAPWATGVVFALLLGAALWAERLGRTEVPLAAGAVLLAAIVGVAVGPRIDADEPWLDYESIAQSLGERGTSSFSWDHMYGPLDWPRDGREVLRIRARRSAYWKATTLSEFDGRRWLESSSQGIEDDPEAATPRAAWVEEVRVTVRNLRTEQFVAPGTTLRIARSPREVVEGVPGSFVTAGRSLRRGHSYLARSYVPRPRAPQLARAGVDYPTEIWPFLTMKLPRSVGGPAGIDPSTMRPDPDADPSTVVFSRWGDERPALGLQEGRGYADRRGTRWIEASRYARSYRLARRLAAGAQTPYDYARRVQAHLQRGFTYSESPPRSDVPLDAFLFRDRIGYCQQFSGAMAMLLRMGGVPARVAGGFSPGTLDRGRGEYVVRDLDAHSWVEAYFPGYGWIAFDPTPSVAPARAQLPAIDLPSERGDEGSETASRGGERASDPGAIDRAGAEGEGGTSPWLIGALAVASLLLAGATVAIVRSRRRRARHGPEEALAELERALRRSGRGPRAGATLRSVEEHFRWAPGAADYVRTVRDGRYGWGGGVPSADQRRALRRELGSGLGLRGRLRALWAVPPW